MRLPKLGEATEHAKPASPATEVIGAMDAAIAKDRTARRKREG